MVLSIVKVQLLNRNNTSRFAAATFKEKVVEAQCQPQSWLLESDVFVFNMEIKIVLSISAILFVTCFLHCSEGLLRRCFVCRSRGELGSCKDPFTINATQVETEKGVETVPCASGWCGKILETENALKEEYGVATQRMCLQRGPSDSEDRCAYTKWQYRKVLMCFCKGDLCNSTMKFSTNTFLVFTSLLALIGLNFI